MNIKMIVATHKDYQMPSDKKLYLPIFVGKNIHPSLNSTFQGDNDGENISNKNSSYNELTALYWAWKNIDSEAIGLVHYRRYLGLHHAKKLGGILTAKQIETLFSEADIILPKKRYYWIETNYSHYIHAHPKEPLIATRKIIKDNYPNYLNAFDKIMHQTSSHIFNMFVMKKNDLDSYCTWLFDILGDLENKLDISEYNDYQKRVYGFISERLLDVWIETNNKSIVEVPVVYLESQHWVLKVLSFIARKFKFRKQ